VGFETEHRLTVNVKTAGTYNQSTLAFDADGVAGAGGGGASGVAGSSATVAPSPSVAP